MDWKKAGFTQRKPKEPGIYYVRTDGHLPMGPPRNLREHWDVAQVFFDAGSYSNAYDNREDFACWRIESLCGMTYAWQRGMWLKGPISPFETPNVELTRGAEKVENDDCRKPSR